VKSCSKCGKELPDEARFCRGCGTPQDTTTSVDTSSNESAQVESPLPDTPLDSDDVSVRQVPEVLVVSANEEIALSDAPIGDAQADLRKAELAAQGSAIAANLLKLAQFDNSQFRDANKDLLERITSAASPPSIEDDVWEKVAKVAGAYGFFIGKSSLNDQQKGEMLEALAWAVRYELSFHADMAERRFRGLVSFLSARAGDTAFLTGAFDNLKPLFAEFDTTFREKCREVLSKFPTSPVIVRLRQMLDMREPPDMGTEMRQALSAVELLWWLLDSKKEEQNQKTMAEARQKRPTPALLQRVAVMGWIICRNALSRYTRNAATLNSGLSDEQLKAAMILAEFASRHSTGSYTADAKNYLLLLKGLQDARSGSLDPAVFTQELKEIFNGRKPDEPAAPGEEVPQNGGSEKKQEPGPLDDFLSEDQQTGLLESMHGLHLDQMRKILRNVRKPLLSALSKILSDPPIGEILPPRRSFIIWGNNGADLFPDARTRIMSPLEDNQRIALRLFEQAVRDATGKDAVAVAREWMLFAQARVYGLHRVISSWKEDYSKRIASWEETWNLAVASVRIKDVVQALEVLKSGVKERDAPFSHLRFALKCSVDILLDAERYSKDTVTMVVAFLLDNLAKLPLPISYLAWLLLADDAQEPIDYDKQLSIISGFQDILDRPIKIQRLENLAEEVTVEGFERDFQSLLAIIQRLEDNYVLELQDDKIAIKSKMLTTFLHTSQVVRKRVGLFVDYENLLPLLPPELQTKPKEVGDMLAQHVSQYGDIVCSWVCVAPRNISDPGGMSDGFQEAGFRVQFPQGRTGRLSPTENLTDFVLVECITFEMMHSKPDIYVIVSGDGDYYEKIMRLLEQRSSVHLVASAKNMASRYRRLEQRSQQSELPEGYGGFFIDNLEKVLQAKLLSQS
jgi:hypothetical protein